MIKEGILLNFTKEKEQESFPGDIVGGQLGRKPKGNPLMHNKCSISTLGCYEFIMVFKNRRKEK